MRNRELKSLLGVCLLLPLFLLFSNGDGMVRRGLSTGRPVIKTFYQKLDNEEEGAPLDDPILSLWREEWSRIGFEPKIITLEDAKRHPYYEIMKGVVEKAFPGDEPAHIYNRYCFYRYLAMAATGGGWHSDYDAMPAYFPLEKAHAFPNEGKFTSFEQFIPSLISASAEEWTFIALLMMDQLSKTKEEWPSDMFMIKDLTEIEGQTDIIVDLLKEENGKVMQPNALMKDDGTFDCSKFKDTWVLHFSHSSMTDLFQGGLLPISGLEEEDIQDSFFRAAVTKKLMQNFRVECKWPALIAEREKQKMAEKK